MKAVLDIIQAADQNVHAGECACRARQPAQPQRRLLSERHIQSDKLKGAVLDAFWAAEYDPSTGAGQHSRTPALLASA